MGSYIEPSLAVADLFNVRGLVAVVTGGATGIGLMMAKALEENGAKVYIIGRRKEVLEKAARQHARHGNIIPLQGDASSKEDLERIVAHITRETGYINLLVANAGIAGPSPIRITPSASLEDIQRQLWNTDSADIDQVFNVHVRGVYFAFAAFLPLLNAGNEKGNVTQSSQMIITGSIGAFGRVPLAHFSYLASKAGVTHMAKQLATAFTCHKIRFNVVAPGCESCKITEWQADEVQTDSVAVYPSEITERVVDASESLTPEEHANLVGPLGRPGSIEDAAGCILWLASKAGAWVSGNVLVTDGGKLGLVPSTY